MPPHQCLACDTLWHVGLDARSSTTPTHKEPGASPTTPARISVPQGTEVCVSQVLEDVNVLRYMWVAEFLSHSSSLVAGIRLVMHIVGLSLGMARFLTAEKTKILGGVLSGHRWGLFFAQRQVDSLCAVQGLMRFWVFELLSIKRELSLIYKLQLCQAVYSPPKLAQVWIFIVMNVEPNDPINKKFLVWQDARDIHRHCLTFSDAFFVKKFTNSKRKIAEENRVHSFKKD